MINQDQLDEIYKEVDRWDTDQLQELAGHIECVLDCREEEESDSD